MKMKIYKIALCALMMLIVNIFNPANAQFLVDDSNFAPEAERQVEAEKSRVNELPTYVVRNIKAYALTDIKGAIKITWETRPDSDFTFIVGRCKIIPGTPEVALKATSVKIIPPGATNEFIDSNLPPGEYYYVILAKEKVLDRDVELYPDVNFTTNPVIIENKIAEPQVIRQSQQVTLIHAMAVNKTQVLLTWKGIDKPGYIYTVHRARTPINSVEQLNTAEKIAVITDSAESYVDRTIKSSGSYYFAVTIRDGSESENLSLVPEQNYTTSPLVISFRQESAVRDLRVDLMFDSSVKLSWDTAADSENDGVIYRFDQIISTPEQLAMATPVGTAPVSQKFYIDKNPGPGNHYYAVLIKQGDGTITTVFKQNDNYSITPVYIGKPLRVIAVKAEKRDTAVTINWNYSGVSGDKNFKIIRCSSLPEKIEDLADGYLLEIVDVTTVKYLDQNPPSGEYYYAVIPRTIPEGEAIKLFRGVNVTEYPVQIIGSEPEKVIPKKKAPENVEPLIVQENLVHENPVVVPPVDTDKNKIQIEPEKENKKPVIKKPEKKVKKSVKKIEPPVEEIEPGTNDVNAILKRTYFNGNYTEAVKELKSLVKTSDNRYDVAKAKYFIGRSYIELRDYDKAISYLIDKDVQQLFPKESVFWAEFAISKKN